MGARVHFDSGDLPVRGLKLSEVSERFSLRAEMGPDGRVYKLVDPSDSAPKAASSFSAALPNLVQVHELISGDELTELLKNAASGRVDPTAPELAATPEFRKFARLVDGAESPKSKLQRGVRKIQSLIGPNSAGKMLHPTYWQEALLPSHPYERYYADYFKKWKAAQTNLSFEDWLSQNKEWSGLQSSQAIGSVHYLTPAEAEQYVVSFKDGRLVKDNVPLNTESFNTRNEPGKAIFVISPEGRLYAGSHRGGSFHHSSFLAGQPVLGAGDIRTNAAGEICAVSNLSGHYRPSKRELSNTLKFLQDQGVDLSKVRVQFQDTDGMIYFYKSAELYVASDGNCQPDENEEMETPPQAPPAYGNGYGPYNIPDYPNVGGYYPEKGVGSELLPQIRDLSTLAAKARSSSASQLSALAQDIEKTSRQILENIDRLGSLPSEDLGQVSAAMLLLRIFAYDLSIRGGRDKILQSLQRLLTAYDERGLGYFENPAVLEPIQRELASYFLGRSEGAMLSQMAEQFAAVRPDLYQQTKLFDRFLTTQQLTECDRLAASLLDSDDD